MSSNFLHAFDIKITHSKRMRTIYLSSPSDFNPIFKSLLMLLKNSKGGQHLLLISINYVSPSYNILIIFIQYFGLSVSSSIFQDLLQNLIPFMFTTPPKTENTMHLYYMNMNIPKLKSKNHISHGHDWDCGFNE